MLALRQGLHARCGLQQRMAVGQAGQLVGQGHVTQFLVGLVAPGHQHADQRQAAAQLGQDGEQVVGGGVVGEFPQPGGVVRQVGACQQPQAHRGGAGGHQIAPAAGHRTQGVQAHPAQAGDAGAMVEAVPRQPCRDVVQPPGKAQRSQDGQSDDQPTQGAWSQPALQGLGHLPLGGGGCAGGGQAEYRVPEGAADAAGDQDQGPAQGLQEKVALYVPCCRADRGTHGPGQGQADGCQVDGDQDGHRSEVQLGHGCGALCFYWKATSAKLRSLRLCRRCVPPSRSSSTARMPMRRCWSTRSR